MRVPGIIEWPGRKLQGSTNVPAVTSDILPTLADLVGVPVPKDYEINGESLVPFLFGDATDHRDWLYAYRMSEQLIRGRSVMPPRLDGEASWRALQGIANPRHVRA